MAGTRAGGQAAAATNKKKYGADFYARIGAKGGFKGRTGGFASLVDCTCKVIPGAHYVKNCAGRKGGKLSKRRKMEAYDN